MSAATPPPSLSGHRVAFVGGGNMAQSLIGGLVSAGVPTAQLRVAEPAPAAAAACRALGVAAVVDDGATAVRDADVVVLAVKPQIMREVTSALAPALAGRPLVVSVAAGITIADLDRWLGGGQAIVRAMPNTPALVGAGAAGLCANRAVDAAGRAIAEALLASVGRVVWIADESLMDAVTALSGSGPAYFFLFMELLAEEGAALGLEPEVARVLAVQTAVGAARMAETADVSPAELRARVTSPNGTTAAALAALELGGLRALVRAALVAARDRGRELAAETGGRS